MSNLGKHIPTDPSMPVGLSLIGRQHIDIVGELADVANDLHSHYQQTASLEGPANEQLEGELAKSAIALEETKREANLLRGTMRLVYSPLIDAAITNRTEAITNRTEAILDDDECTTNETSLSIVSNTTYDHPIGFNHEKVRVIRDETTFVINTRYGHGIKFVNSHLTDPGINDGEDGSTIINRHSTSLSLMLPSKAIITLQGRDLDTNNKGNEPLLDFVIKSLPNLKELAKLQERVVERRLNYSWAE